MRHVSVREMAVREAQLEDEAHVNHIQGKLNPADLITKEHKNGEIFIQLCDLVVPCRSDGGCRIPDSEILYSDQQGRADTMDSLTTDVNNVTIGQQKQQTNQ